MSMAITTRYIGPSNTRDPRVKATARKAEDWGDIRHQEMSLTDSWDHSSNSEENHCRVAHLCAVKLGWQGLYIMGDLPGSERVYVNVCRAEFAIGPMIELLRETGLIYDRDYFLAAPAKRD